MRLSMDVEKIIWPGNLVKKPTGLMIPTHLNVLTIAEKPFVYHRILNSSDTCDAEKGEILCPHYNTEPTDVQRCKSCFFYQNIYGESKNSQGLLEITCAKKAINLICSLFSLQCFQIHRNFQIATNHAVLATALIF